MGLRRSTVGAARPLAAGAVPAAEPALEPPAPEPPPAPAPEPTSAPAPARAPLAAPPMQPAAATVRPDVARGARPVPPAARPPAAAPAPAYTPPATYAPQPAPAYAPQPAPAYAPPPAPVYAPEPAAPPPARFEPPAPPADRDDGDGDGRMVGADERPGGAVALTEHVTLVVYPFRSFGALNEFQAAMRGLRGVKNLRVRRFYKGTLHLAVEYEDVIPLTQRLRDLTAFPWEIVSESRGELELRLDAGRSFAAGEGDR
jgi:hypothetical protein